MPKDVIARAKTLLAELESHAVKHPTPQLSLFGKAPELGDSGEDEDAAKDPVRAALLDLDPDRLSPREAHSMLYDLVRLSKEDA